MRAVIKVREGFREVRPEQFYIFEADGEAQEARRHPRGTLFRLGDVGVGNPRRPGEQGVHAPEARSNQDVAASIHDLGGFGSGPQLEAQHTPTEPLTVCRSKERGVRMAAEAGVMHRLDERVRSEPTRDL